MICSANCSGTYFLVQNWQNDSNHAVERVAEKRAPHGGVVPGEKLMRNIFSVLVCAGIVLCLQATSAIASVSCEKLFEQTDRLAEQAGKEKDEKAQKNYLGQITASIISATESYLNNCTDTKSTISKQSSAVSQLAKIAKQDCPSSESATQFIDINKDGNNQLIVHAKLLACEDFSGPYGAGFSSIYFLDKESGAWKGYPIWPDELVEKSSSAMEITGFIYPQFNPKIYMLDFKDSKGRTFMAIESEFEGGDNLTNLLAIIRWDSQKHKTILNLDLSDWCGQTHYWTITQKGTVEVPAARATDRCKKRAKKVYSLEQP